ncbi:MAG: ABC transporter permease [Sphingobacteriales bacterium]|nr:ABC transporter permease [Sphingobacteriales bacterium]
MNFLFAWRYFKAKKSTNAINIIAWTSIAAIIIGTTALILVLSVFNGFEGLVKSLYSTFYTDLKVTPASGKVMTVSAAQVEQLKGVASVRNFARVLEEKAMLQNGDNQTVIYLKGVDENYRYVTGVAGHLINGEFNTGTVDEPRLVLGAGVEDALGIYADRNLLPLNIYLPRKTRSKQLDLLEDISIDSAWSSAAFMIQQDFDNKYGITNIDFLRSALRLGPDEYSGIEITLRDPGTLDQSKQAVEKIFGRDYLVQDRYQQNRSLYSIMNVERWIVYGVLCLILIVAAFNMIGALTMLVLEKQKDISVLHALGGNQGFIQRVFLSEGLLLAGVGGGLGMLLAMLLAWLQVNYHLIPLQGGSFLIDYYPVKLRAWDFVLVGGTVFFISFLASWIPSRKAARQEFSLRSE